MRSAVDVSHLMAASFQQTPADSHALSSDGFATSASRWLPWLFWMLVVIPLPLMVTASADFGVTWDEGDRHLNGQAILEFFRGLRPREEAHYGTMYPGLVDVIPAWLEEQVPVDRYVLRHRVTAVFGWAGIVFTGLLARRLFGPWSGILAVILLAASPRYIGDSMNNPKDLPFAAMSVMALYFMSKLSPRWPYISVGTGALIAVAFALALSTRPGGLLFFGYLPLLLLAFVVVHRTTAVGHTLVIDRQVNWRAAADSAARVGVVLVAGLLLGTIFWPWAQAAPFTRPFEALSKASEYPWEGGLVFGGVEYSASDVPWSYLPTWLLISTPPVVLAGMALAIVAHVRGWGFPRLALWGAALLPIAFIIVHDSTVYDGIRHVLFVYPPMVVLAASGWTGLLAHRRRWLQAGGLALLIAGLANILAFNIRAYPNQVVYVNELAGGPRGAFARYELDYWGNCLLQAVDWTANAARRAQMPVIIWGRPQHLVEADAARFPELTVTPDRTDPHHLQIFLLRGSILDVRALADRGDAVHFVTTPDGAALCGIYRGPDFEQLDGRLRAFSGPSS